MRRRILRQKNSPATWLLTGRNVRLVAAFAIGLLASAAFAGPLEEGQAAYEIGDYSTAFSLWRPLGEQGVAQAQYNLGVMYARGLGVPNDYSEAVTWYRKAADQGHSWAQNDLGLMCAEGLGVPQDKVEAYKWFALAAADSQLGQAVANRDRMASEMTSEQIAEAQNRIREWKPTEAAASFVPRAIIFDPHIKRYWFGERAYLPDWWAAGYSSLAELVASLQPDDQRLRQYADDYQGRLRFVKNVFWPGLVVFSVGTLVAGGLGLHMAFTNPEHPSTAETASFLVFGGVGIAGGILTLWAMLSPGKPKELVDYYNMTYAEK